MFAKFIPLFGGMAALLFVIWRSYEVGYNVGYSDLSQENFANYRYQIEQATERANDLKERLDRIDALSSSETAKLRKQIDELNKAANNYNTKPINDDAACFDNEWVLIHNGAVNLSGQHYSKPTSVDDDSTGAVTTSDAIKTITDNYATCAIYIKQLEALQKYTIEILKNAE